MEKIKAHQKWEDQKTLEQKATFIGNDLADEAAKRGASLRPRPSEAERTCAGAAWELHKDLVRAVGKLLQLFPTIRAGQGRNRLKKTAKHEAEQQQRAEERKNKEEARTSLSNSFLPASQHSFCRSRLGTFFFCRHCFARATSQQYADERTRSQECTGIHPNATEGHRDRPAAWAHPPGSSA